ncbi:MULTISPECIES: 3-oxoacyl-ACP reductase family protein [Mycobacteroides]
MVQKFQGRGALVTGGSRGIGAAIVRRLAAEGADVAFTYSSSSAEAMQLVTEVQELGGQAIAIRADNADPALVRDAVDTAIRQLGKVDILINNAAIFALSELDSFSLDDFDRFIAVNVRAVFSAIKAVVPQMGVGGRIITIGSINGDRSPNKGLSLYSMSKAAVAGLTRGLARELGERGITINNIQPGPISTDMNPAEGELADALKPLIAVGHYGEVGDIASLVSYLASNEAGYITGASLNIDGGFGV